MAASRVTAAGAVLLIALTGCTSAPAPAPRSDITASAYRSRVDDATGGQFQITVTNTGEKPVDVHSVALGSPGFEAVPPSVRDVRLQHGSRIDIPTLYGAAVCDSSVEPLTARLSVTVEGENLRNIDVPLDQPYDIVDRIHSEECTAERVDSDVTMTLSISAPPAVTTDPLIAGLTFTRGDFDGPIRADELAGSLLYGLDAALPETLDAGQDSMTVPVTITTASCEAHVIADSKKPFVFPIYLAFGDDKPVYARIPVPTDLQRQLVAYEQTACRR